MAAATALIEGYNTPGEDTTVSCLPNALVLYNPVIDNGPAGYGHDRIGTAYRSFSPLHNLSPAAPPTLCLLGTKDPLIPVATARYYQMASERLGARCEIALYKGAAPSKW